MGSMDYKMMMESGVLRPGDMAIRRGPGGLPLYATGELPEFLNHSLDVLFGSQPGENCTSNRYEENRPAARSEASPSSFKAVMMRLGLLHEDNKLPLSKQPPLPNPMVSLERKLQTLELLLKEEQARSQKQTEELGILRSQLKSIDGLQADLAIERESSKQLVEWLQEAERQLADAQGRRLTLVGAPPRKASYFPEGLNKDKG